jgi:hypothetical protein
MAITRTIAAASKTILLPVREAIMNADDNSGHQAEERSERMIGLPNVPLTS